MSPKTQRVDRTRTELWDELRRQLKFLRDACSRFDEGDLDYALQIATKLRVLLYDKGQSVSVLRQLEQTFSIDRREFPDLSTTRGEFSNVGHTDFVRASLCQYEMNHDLDAPSVLTVRPIAAQEGGRYPARAFRTWWERQNVILLDREHFLTRVKAVTLLANQDGGAHVDPQIEQELALLKRNEARPLRIVVSLPDGGRKEYTAQINQVLSATVRTIAEETMIKFHQDILPQCTGKV